MKAYIYPLIAFIIIGCGCSKIDDGNKIFCEFVLEQKAKSFDAVSNETIYLVGMEEIFAFPECYDKKLISTNGAIKILPIDGSIWLFQDKDRARVESFNTVITTPIKQKDLINQHKSYFEGGISMGSVMGRFEWEIEPASAVRWLRFVEVMVIRVHERRGDESKEFDERLYYKAS